MHITRWGDTGPVVVMVHGSAQGSRAEGGRHFARQESLASRGWQIVVPDRPGHGLSPAPGRPDDARGRSTDRRAPRKQRPSRRALIRRRRRAGSRRATTECRAIAHDHRTRIAAVRHARSGGKEIRFQRHQDAEVHPRRCQTGNQVQSTRQRPTRDARRRRQPGRTGRPGQGSRRPLKLPSKSDVSRQLDTIAEHHIPFVVITGGWSPAFEAIGASASARGGGTHVVIDSDHHFPNLVSEEFNDTLDTLMRNADASHREQA